MVSEPAQVLAPAGLFNSMHHPTFYRPKIDVSKIDEQPSGSPISKAVVL
jgi:hypothetical protein